jgi:SET domain
MPVFTFKINNRTTFHCKLVSHVCGSKCKDGSPCNKKVVFGLPLCWMHMLLTKHLRLKKSLILNAGKGVFAIDIYKEKGDIVFRKGDVICTYEGELIDNNEVEDRYKDQSAPYTLQVNDNDNIDCACERHIGSVINTKPKHNNCCFVVKDGKNATIYATKTIRNNDELYVSYGRRYRMHGEFSHTTK